MKFLSLPFPNPLREQYIIDPDNEQFVIYVRSEGLQGLYPLNVVTGGSTANTLVKGLESNVSKDLAKKVDDKQHRASHIQGRNSEECVDACLC